MSIVLHFFLGREDRSSRQKETLELGEEKNDDLKFIL